MTPFEQAKKNIEKLAENLSFAQLVQVTLKETANLPDEESDMIWKAILTMLQTAGKLEEDN